MSEKRQSAAKKIIEKDIAQPKLEVDLGTEGSNLPDKVLSPEENYRRHKAEVTRRDHEEFLQYEQGKARQQMAAQAQRNSTGVAESKPTKVDRRNLLSVIAGTAAIGEAAALGYSIVKDQTTPAHGARHAGDTYTEAQRHNIGARVDQSQSRHWRPGFRRLGSAGTNQVRGWNIRNKSQHRQVPRLDHLLAIWRFQPDIPSPLRFSERRSDAGVRMDQQHPGRQEFINLWHSDQHRDPRGGVQYLPGAL
jgi:hypothetical protein